MGEDVGASLVAETDDVLLWVPRLASGWFEYMYLYNNIISRLAWESGAGLPYVRDWLYLSYNMLYMYM